MNTALNIVKKWTIANRSSVNVNKIFILLFYNRNYDLVRVIFDNKNVQFKANEKFLGVLPRQ